jgi:hypothetical protein
MDQVLISTIRKVMPNVIANDILGVQPMTGPVSSIFSNAYRNSLRRNVHRGIRPEREIFNHFLRINNRKKLFVLKDFLDSGYTYVNVNNTQIGNGTYEWMSLNMRHRYVCIHNHIFFANEQDKILFLLRWS